MNFGILVSYIIAGILMLTILTVSYNMTYNATEMSMTQTKKSHTQALVDMVTYDIPKIGYQIKETLTTKFVKADSNEIVFYANIDNSPDKSVETVRWKYTDTPAPDSKNPNDLILERVVDGNKIEFDIGITQFEIRYYNEYGSSTPMSTPVSSSNYDDIKQIEITMTLESQTDLRYSDNYSKYISTRWQKRFSPVNLREQ